MPPGGEAAFLAPLPVRALPGVGPKAQARLADAGVTTIGRLADLDDGRLAPLLPGRVGEELRRRARGIDPRPVAAEPAEAISLSNEETFARDIGDREELHGHLRAMAESLAGSLLRRGMTARTVTTKLRYPDFAIVTRSQSFEVGIDDAATIGNMACELLDRALRQRPGPIRLAGVGVAGFDRHKQLVLPGTGAEPSTPDYATAGLRSSRCWCDGQYSRSGSGVRWQGLPLRVVARHCCAVPSPARSSSSMMYSIALEMCRSIERYTRAWSEIEKRCRTSEKRLWLGLAK